MGIFKQKHFLRKQSPTLRKLMLSFLLMLVLPSIVLLFNYVYARRLLQQENMNYQNAVLVQVQKMVDEQLQSLQLFAIDLSNDTAINSFLEGRGSSENTINFQIYELSNHLKKYNAPYKTLVQCMLYSVRYDCLVSADWADSGVSDKMIRLDTAELNQKLIQRLKEERLYCNYELLEDKDGNRELVMLHSLPLWSTGRDSLGAICLSIDTKVLLRNVDTMGELQNGLVCLLDENGKTIAFSGREGLLDVLSKAEAVENGFIDIAGESYTVTTAVSELNGWKFLSIQPEHLMLKKLQTTRNISLVMVGATLVIGLFLATLLSRKNYKPLENLMASMRQNSLLLKEQINADENEFHLIERSVNNMMGSVSLVRQALQEELPIIKENMLTQLLKNAVEDYTAFTETLSNLGIMFPHKQFCIAVIRLVSPEGAQMEEQAVFPVILKEQMAQLRLPEFNYATVNPHTKLLVLIMNSQAETFEEITCRVMNSLFESMLTDYSYMTSICVSKVVEGIEQVPYAYYSALHTYSKLTNGGVAMVKDHADHPKRPAQGLDEISTLLQNYILTGNEEGALSLLRQHYTANFGLESIPLHEVRSYFISLLNMALNDNPVEQMILIRNTDPMQLLFIQDTPDQMEETVEAVVMEICRTVQKNQKSHASQLAEQIQEFMEKEYANSDLTLSYVADHFYITSSYLSTFFKENVGETFLNYLTHIRIEQSKKLIRETNLTMGEIAEKVGYTSGNTFTRIFKKVEHITPTQYKEGAN